MTEMTVEERLETRFILHWGEMGTRWGVNRTVAQIHALLYLSAEPLSAESIASKLGVSRSNVSTSLRELLGWGIIRTTSQLGVRTTYYESLLDVWEMFRIIVEERRRRELDPTRDLLRECVSSAKRDGANGILLDRLEQMSSFFEAATSFHDEFAGLSGSSLRKVMRMPRRLKTLIGLGWEK